MQVYCKRSFWWILIFVLSICKNEKPCKLKLKQYESWVWILCSNIALLQMKYYFVKTCYKYYLATSAFCKIMKYHYFLNLWKSLKFAVHKLELTILINSNKRKKNLIPVFVSCEFFLHWVAWPQGNKKRKGFFWEADQFFHDLFKNLWFKHAVSI